MNMERPVGAEEGELKDKSGKDQKERPFKPDGSGVTKVEEVKKKRKGTKPNAAEKKKALAANPEEAISSEEISPEILKAYKEGRSEKIEEEAKEKGLGERSLGTVRNIGTWYKKQSLWVKLPLAGALMGISIGGAAVGGATGTALLAAAFTGSAFSRTMGAASMFVTAEALSRHFLWKENSRKQETGENKRYALDRHVLMGVGAAAATLFLPKFLVEQSGAGEWMQHLFEKIHGSPAAGAGNTAYSTDHFGESSEEADKMYRQGLASDAGNRFGEASEVTDKMYQEELASDAGNRFGNASEMAEQAWMEKNAATGGGRTLPTFPENFDAHEAAVEGARVAGAPFNAFPEQVTVQKGDSLWKIVGHQLEGSEEYQKLTSAQKNYVTDYYVKHLQKVEGFSSTQIIHPGDKIDLSSLNDKAFHDTVFGKVERVGVGHAVHEHVTHQGSKAPAVHTVPENHSAVGETFIVPKATEATPTSGGPSLFASAEIKTLFHNADPAAIPAVNKFMDESLTHALNGTTMISPVAPEELQEYLSSHLKALLKRPDISPEYLQKTFGYKEGKIFGLFGKTFSFDHSTLTVRQALRELANLESAIEKK